MHLSDVSAQVRLVGIDWLIIVVYFAMVLLIGLWSARRAQKSSEQFFLSGRSMPWWLLGASMVATTFSTDTPNLVTDIVRQHGVAGNWMWWAFLPTGMLTVFVYARLWRKSGVMTDVEFYEIRYSGRNAAFLRGFRALYLGVFFNVMIMATVTLAAIKIGGVMLGLSPIHTILIASVVTVIFCTFGGFEGVLLTDFVLFALAMGGSFAAAIISLRHPAIGGLAGLLTHTAVQSKLSLLPAFDFSTTDKMNMVMTVFIIPIAVQWWSVWYPGSEPGGGGYIAQRMLAAKNEKHAIGATLFFNAAHYALRPWPWIIVALCSLVVFPDLASLRAAFPNVSENIVRNDLAYSAMLTFLPAGLMGFVMASLMAAYMSTISTHLNWGSSYIVNDFYRRFVKPSAGERELVAIGQVSTVLLMAISAGIALYLENAVQAFQILLQIGAGTGLLFILRWFWWRINAVSEITAMTVSFAAACYFQFIHHGVLKFEPMADWQKMIWGVGITTVCWVAATFLTRPTEKETLVKFYMLIRPWGRGWKKILADAGVDETMIEQSRQEMHLPGGILCMLLGCTAVYAALFATGQFIYGRIGWGVGLSAVFATACVLLFAVWKKMNRQ
jgi:solute:Na+ symporter, SSS family